MKKTKIILILFFIVFKISAQKLVNNPNNTNLKEYFIGTSSMPDCFKSDKIKKLIPNKNHFSPLKISEKDFNSLNAYEHFIYSFYYPEWYYQSCSLFPLRNNILQKISAILIMQGEGLRMSKRQQNAIIQHKDSTILLMKQCIDKSKVINNRFKENIISLKAYQLIPTLIKTLKNQKKIKDPYILTTLCLLMRFDYQPFINSKIYSELYPIDSNKNHIFKRSNENTIPFTQENYKTILNFASDYFKFKNEKLSAFINIKRGKYTIGEKEHFYNPLKKVKLKAFQISRYEITNKQFKQFIESTDYITLAEKNKDAFVFRLGLAEFEWTQDSTANWKFPNGVSKGGIEDKMNHPVTCISYIDAKAYCKWAEVRLPTFEEWEIASRGGQNEKRHYFEGAPEAIYQHANIWHGKTHLMKYEGEDYVTTSPVGSFKPNQFGLYDIYGNVFEFCSNKPEAFSIYKNVTVTRGGSWWCSLYACGFFNSVDIGRVQKEATFSNNGFRVVL